MSYKEKTFYQRVMARHAEMDEERKVWDSQRQEIVEYFRPDITKYSIKDTSETGKFLHEIVEGTGAWSAGVMARGFQGSLVGPTIKWLRSRFRDMRFRGDDELNAFLQRFDDYLLETVFRHSNFYEIIGPNVLDGITIGSPVLLVEEDERTGQIIFKLPHYQENYLKRDWFGNDIAYHRLFEVDGMSAEQHFGMDNLPETIQLRLQTQGDHKTRDKYLMVIYHRDDPIFKDLPESKIKKPSKKSNIEYRPVPMREWCLYYLPYACDDERYQGVIPYREKRTNAFVIPGYMHKPFSAWHYFRNPHETYSRTPAWAAIYDEKGGQSAWTSMYEVGEKAARPPMYAMKGMKKRVKSAPGKFTWMLSDAEYDRPPKPLEENTRYFDYSNFLEKVDEKRKRHFHIDLFRMLDEYHSQHKQPPTAYEIAQMLAEKNVQIGPAIESFDRGLLAPVYDRIVEIEARSGRLFNQTQPPMEVFETNGEIMAQLVGPLAQAQKIAVMMRRVQDPLSMADYIFERWPDSIHKIKPDVLLENILEESDFYQNAIASQEEYEQRIASLNMMRQQERNAQLFEIMSKGMSKLQKSSQPGSPMKMLEETAV